MPVWFRRRRKLPPPESGKSQLGYSDRGETNIAGAPHNTDLRHNIEAAVLAAVDRPTSVSKALEITSNATGRDIESVAVVLEELVSRGELVLEEETSILHPVSVPVRGALAIMADACDGRFIVRKGNGAGAVLDTPVLAWDYLHLSGGAPLAEAAALVEQARKSPGQWFKFAQTDLYNEDRYDLRRGNSPQLPLDASSALPADPAPSRGDLIRWRAEELARMRHGFELSEMPFEDQRDLLFAAEGELDQESRPVTAQEEPPQPLPEQGVTEWEMVTLPGGKKIWRAKSDPNITVERPQGGV